MSRKTKTMEELVIEFAIQYWIDHQTGCDSLRIAQALKLDNEQVKAAMLELEAAGLASLNKNVALTPLTFGAGGIKRGAPVQCHVIFPSKAVLTEHFYRSDLVRRNLPIFEERVMKGSHTYSFVYFYEEVLRKYLTRPDLYDVHDTVSGGHITYLGEEEFLYIDIRHGRRKLENGRSAVTAFLTDLLKLSEAEQRYWHGYEIKEALFAEQDKGFSDFIDVNLEGRWISYKDPLKDALAAIERVNERLEAAIFRRTHNTLLHAPVENTQRAYCDSCNELYKLIGNDSINKKILEYYLVENFGTDETEFTHNESKRPLSGIQLLELLELKANAGTEASKIIRSIGENRIKAAHALSFDGNTDKIYIDMFHDQCEALATGLDSLSDKVAESVKSRKKAI